HAHLARTAPDTLRITATDPTGQPVLTVGELTTRTIAREQLAAAGAATDGPAGLLLPAWTPLPAGGAEEPMPLGPVAVIGADPLGLAEALREAGGDAASVRVYDTLGALRAAVDDGVGVPARALVTCVGGPAGEEVPDAMRAVLGRATAHVQEWLADERFGDAQLVVVTRDAVAARPGPEIRDLAAAPVWGLVRSASTEHPGRFALLDVGAGPVTSGTGASGTGAALVRALAGRLAEAAVRDGGVQVPRLVRAADASGVLTPPDGCGSWRLDVTSKGTLAHLALLPHPEGEGPLKGHEIRVAMRAGGLNFRDVMVGLGMYPGDDARIGGEGAGVVVEVGSQVTAFSPGDRVMGLFPSGGLGPVGVTDHRWAARIPRGLTFQQAAVVPVVYLTAYYGLVDLAGLGRGERLLVHSAAGGVGMAALQIARHL
ncbi:SpnB-like Rossmann fold domain-containing protein, partial [Streptomyces sp. AK04-3B]|uniref:SpnB-like Rossmann fold domain-containing protein n=1 Tax=Streptomyces sp. AK04-3B TaxID=3028650 RepID=UPI0029B5B091